MEMIQVRIIAMRSTIELVFPWAKKTKQDSRGSPPPGVLRERCSENIQQVYKGATPMPKCDLLCDFIEIHFGMGVLL